MKTLWTLNCGFQASRSHLVNNSWDIRGVKRLATHNAWPIRNGDTEMKQRGFKEEKEEGNSRFNLNLFASSLSPLTRNAKSKQIFSFKHSYNESIVSHLGQRLQKQRRKWTFSDPVIPHAWVNFSFLLFSSNLENWARLTRENANFTKSWGLIWIGSAKGHGKFPPQWRVK